jgi:hypothetical protein
MKSQKTQTNRRPWIDLAIEIRQVLDARGYKAKSLSEEAGITIDAAYRILGGGLKRTSAPARVLIAFFKINTNETANNALRSRIDVQIDQVWDGSEGHAELICRLIKSTKDLIVTKS